MSAGDDPRIDAVLAAAEPTEPKPAAALLARLAAAGLALAPGAPAPDDLVTGVTEDSRRIAPGACFVAIAGAHADGHDHLEEAAARGASLALVERRVDGARAGGLRQVEVVDGRQALATAACWWYEDPSQALGVVGVTGTDGKTTTSFLAVAALEAAGIPTGLIGTVETKVGRVREGSAEHVTTPSAPALQRALRAMRLAGDEAVVVETTSHGLALARVDGIRYDAAIFTNLSHEHLELHGTFEAYRAAKVSLFARLGATGPKRVGGRVWEPVGIVNVDDPNASHFADATRLAGARLVTYGLDRHAAVRATSIEEDAHRLSFAVTTPGWSGRVALRLAGRFNVHNALAVVALGHAIGLDPEAVRSGLDGVAAVPGRMERLEAGQPFGVVIDYAHSPASLEHVLEILGPLAAGAGGGLIAVFGSAGERDRAKRPLMGRIAGERCRLVVVTDEDPRGEDPGTILEEIAAGAEAAGRRSGDDLLLIADRRAALVAAFERARPGDLVLLAGKGHERTIIRADGPEPWDERTEAIAALAALGWGEPPSG